jgi:hypothetical protein
MLPRRIFAAVVRGKLIQRRRVPTQHNHRTKTLCSRQIARSFSSVPPSDDLSDTTPKGAHLLPVLTPTAVIPLSAFTTLIQNFNIFIF